MPTENSKVASSTNNAEANRPRTIPMDLDFDVIEWLESERLEHEKRMQKLGCLPHETNKQHGVSEKHVLKDDSIRLREKHRRKG